MNALNSKTLKELIQINNELKKDFKTRVIIYQTSGDNFSAGADIKEIPKKKV